MAKIKGKQLFTLLALVMLGSCSPAPDEDDSDICVARAGTGISIENGWVRAASAGRTVTAAYLTICNIGAKDDQLERVSSPAATATELHKTSRDAQGRVRMAPVTALTISANSHSMLAPGGHHLMLIGLEGPIEAGDVVRLDLFFRDAGLISTTLPVQALVPNRADVDGGDHEQH